MKNGLLGVSMRLPLTATPAPTSCGERDRTRCSQSRISLTSRKVHACYNNTGAAKVSSLNHQWNGCRVATTEIFISVPRYSSAFAARSDGPSEPWKSILVRLGIGSQRFGSAVLVGALDGCMSGRSEFDFSIATSDGRVGMSTNHPRLSFPDNDP